jgi:hypothetical protein
MNYPVDQCTKIVVFLWLVSVSQCQIRNRRPFYKHKGHLNGVIFARELERSGNLQATYNSIIRYFVHAYFSIKPLLVTSIGL